MGHLLLHYMKLEVLWQSVNRNPRFSQRDPIQLASEFFFGRREEKKLGRLAFYAFFGHYLEGEKQEVV